MINLERRGIVGVPLGDGTKPPTSGVWLRLFPSESQVHDPGLSPAEAGLSLGHFEVQERIGAGGMGAVFRANDTRLDRAVALKILTPSLSRDDAAVQRFRNEARAAARLDHENIARVYFIGEDQGLNFIAFEFINGENLRNLIIQQGRVEPVEAVNFVLQITSALRHTSANGVVHRDIKPSNIIITPSGRAKLVDLGLARKEHSESAADLTLAGTTLGTFDYISPEQAKDPRNVDVRSDIYSLGCTLYHMLTGEPPYPDGTVLKKLLDHQSGEPPDPAKKNRRVSDDLSMITRKMMASDPKKRYQTPDQLTRDLMLIAGSLGLRGVSPEGLIWLSSRPSFSDIWRQNAGVLAMTSLLVLIVFGVSQFPNLAANRGQGTYVTNAGSQSHESQRSNGTTQNSKTPDRDNPSHAKSTDSHHKGSLANGFQPAELISPSGRSTSDDANPPLTTKVERVENPPSAIVASSRNTNNATVTKTDNGNFPTRPSTGNSVTEPVREPTNTAGKPPAIAEEAIGVFVLAADGAASKRFPTLEAACAAVTDGSTIELRFNGRRAEKPIKLGKKNLTIRAGKGFHPIIEFNPANAPADAHLRLINVSSGPVEISQVAFEITVPPFLSVDRISLFGLERQDALALHGVAITLNNPGQRPTSLFDLAYEPGQMMADMKMNNVGAARELKLELTECFIRGQGDLIHIRHTKPVRLTLRDTAVTLDGTLLRVEGHSEKPAEQSRIELRLDYVTGRFGRHLVQLDSGDLPRELAPVHVEAKNNILTTVGNTGLIAMSGSTSDSDFRKLLSWSGEKNFYAHCQLFWTLASGAAPLDFDEWKAAWGAGGDVGASNDELLFQARQGEWSQTTLESLTLDRRTETFNPALGAATDGNDAGANVAKLLRQTEENAK